MMQYVPNTLTGDERLANAPPEIQDTPVLAFWQWAFSNLCANNIRGIFAEWLVARLLLLPQPQPLRDSWTEWDLTTPEGVTIEVKTSAYIQTWSQTRLSKVVFRGLKGRRLNIATNQYASVATFNADLYVFCMHIERDATVWNALNLCQWRFYLLRHETVARLNYQSVSLATLAIHSQELNASTFREQAQAMIEDIAQSRAAMV
jgi:hypothetical protein